MVKLDDSRNLAHWLASLRAGDPEAAPRLWKRYFKPLVQVARLSLRGGPRAVADEEDAALDALDSFLRGVARDRYPELDDSEDLWRLLVVITRRKVLDQVQRERQKKRGGGLRIGPLTLPLARAPGKPRRLEAASSSERTPEYAAMMVEEYRILVTRLPDPRLRQVARLRLDGFTSEEIAGQLGCSVRSVARRVDEIRKIWLEEDDRAGRD